MAYRTGSMSYRLLVYKPKRLSTLRVKAHPLNDLYHPNYDYPKTTNFCGRFIYANYVSQSIGRINLYRMNFYWTIYQYAYKALKRTKNRINLSRGPF